MKNNKVLIAIENRSLFNKISTLFTTSGFEVVSSDLDSEISIIRDIVFFTVDITNAQRYLSIIQTQKEHCLKVLPAVILLPDNENQIDWLKKGFDDTFLLTTPFKLLKVRLQKWIELQKRQAYVAENQKSLLDIVAQKLKSPIIIVNEDGSIDTINQVAVDLFGIDKNEVIGNHWTTFTPKEYQGQLIKLYEEISKGTPPETNSFNFKFKDKFDQEHSWQVSIQVNPISKKFVVIMNDIEQMLESQRAYLQSEHKFSCVMESVNEVFTVSSVDGTYLDVNSFFLNWLGYTRDEVIGKTDLDLNIWYSLADREKFIAGLTKNGVVKELKTVFRAKSGVLIHGALFGRVVSLNNKKYVFASVKDITELENIHVISQILQKIKEFAANMYDEKELYLLINKGFQNFSWFNNCELFIFNKEKNVVFEFNKNRLITTKRSQTDALWLDRIEKEKANIIVTKSEILSTLKNKEIRDNLVLPSIWAGFPLLVSGRYFGSMFFKFKSQEPSLPEQALSMISTVVQEVAFFLAKKKVEGELVVIKQALNWSDSSVVITKTDGTISWVNKAFETLTGYSFEEAVGKNPRILKSGHHPKSFYKKLWDTILSGKVWKNEIINKRKDGTLYHEEDTISPVFDSNKKIIRFIAIKQDISERKKFEQNLKNHLHRQQILNDVLSYYVSMGATELQSIIHYYLEVVGNFVKAKRMCLVEYSNEKLEWSNMYEWSAEDNDGQILKKLEEKDLQKVKNWFLEKINKSVKSCKFSKNEIKDKVLQRIFTQKNIGTLICFPLFHENKRIGFTGFIYSETNYQMQEDEKNLIDIFSYIMINIWLRNASLKELESAKLKAEEAVKLKTSFLANMNHEIRTPMNAVMGFSDLMTEASCEEKDEYAKIVLNSAKQLLKLIDDVIFLSRLQSERLPVTLSECKPAELIDTVFQMFLVSDENVNNLDIRMSYPGKLKDFVFVSDVDKIQQVMTNFVSNALKYTFSGYVDMGFSVEGNKVRFYVKDTGKGIDKEEVPKIFDAFFRSSDVMFSAIRGTGLGLSIAKELVETMGGKIGVNTELNKGSEFYFVLPYKKAETKNENNETTRKTSRQWNELKILVAEDDEESYLYLETLLQKRVKLIDRATDGLQAIKLAIDNDYDLILMDIKMPEVSGLDATRHIKLKKPHSVIFAQTAYAMPEEKKSALQIGCDEYITKPIKKELLYDIIEKKVLSRK